VTFQLINDELLGIKLNLTYEIFEALEKMRVTLKVRLPKSEKDRDYTQDFFQTSIDVEKMFKNVHGNFMIRMITEPYFKALDVKVGKFPIPKVKKKRNWKPKIFYLKNIVQGIYRATNMLISDNYIPFPIKTKALIDCLFMVKVLGRKKSEMFYNWQAHAEINRLVQGTKSGVSSL
jgi:hypothetical protein